MEEGRALLARLEAQEKQAGSCLKRLAAVKQDVGVADVPELVQRREQELAEFSGKLRRLEAQFAELRKLAGHGSPGKAERQEMDQMEEQINRLKEEKHQINRVLGQDLQVFLPQPSKLDDLITLKMAVHNVIELGKRTGRNMETVEDTLAQAGKLRRKIGGMDLLKRLKELEDGERDQAKRLERAKERFEAIGKGANDCDGYTSNTEEATFIVISSKF